MAGAIRELSEKDLMELLPGWQRALRLQDWDVSVKIVRARDMSGKGNFGEARTNLEDKWAEIWLLDPADHDPARQIPYDMEETLVHELIHLHFDPFIAKEGTPELMAQEQAINALAKALVSLSPNFSAPTGA